MWQIKVAWQNHQPSLGLKVAAQTILVSPTPAATPEPTPDPENPTNSPDSVAIEKYIRTIFGSDYKVAVAVSHAECNPRNKKYPACEAISSIEHSVGIFQINLYNKSQWVHAGRIPGETMEEKVDWLKNPYNNSLYAFWIFKNNGWEPWSTYTNGKYLKFL